MEEKEYDVRKIYVGIPAQQSNIKYQYKYGGDAVASWDFTMIPGAEQGFDLFMKTLTGYKSILSSVEYKASSIHTPEKIVLVKRSIHPLGQFSPELLTLIKERFGTYKVNKDALKKIKQIVNIQFVNNYESGMIEEM